MHSHSHAMRILSMHGVVPIQGRSSSTTSYCIFQFLVLLLLFRLEVALSLQSLHHVKVPTNGVSMMMSTATVTSWTVPKTGLLLSEATTLAARVRRDRSMASTTTTQQQKQQQQEQQQDQYYETAFNVTLPVALTILAPELFPSLSKARRLIRQKRILVTIPNTSAQQQEIESAATNMKINQASVVLIGTSATRIYPGHVISVPSLSNHTLLTNMNSSTTTSTGQQKEQQPIANATGYPNLSYTKVPGLLPKVLYQDDDIAILHKLAGMICHSIGKGGYDSNSILKMAPLVMTPPATAQRHFHNDDDSDSDILPLPTLVHRLDTRTSGLLIMSKTKTASVSLSHQFATQQVLKTYHALVHGRPRNEEGILESNIVQMVPTNDIHGNGEGATDVDDDGDNHDGDDDHHGKSATTHYKVLQSMPTSKGTFLSWIEFQPRTGRRHQLRQHAAYELSCPIVGDVLYDRTTNPSSASSSSPYMFLCSTRIAFHHPRTKELLDFSIPTPKRFSAFWEREKGRYENHQRWLLSNDDNNNNNCNTR